MATEFECMCTDIGFSFIVLEGYPFESNKIFNLPFNAYWCRLEYQDRVIQKIIHFNYVPSCKDVMRHFFSNSLVDYNYNLEKVSIKLFEKLKRNTKKLKKFLGGNYNLFKRAYIAEQQ